MIDTIFKTAEVLERGPMPFYTSNNNLLALVAGPSPSTSTPIGPTKFATNTVQTVTIPGTQSLNEKTIPAMLSV